MIIHCKLNNSSGKVYNIHILWHVSGDSRIQKLFWFFAVLVIWHCGSDFARNVTRNSSSKNVFTTINFFYVLELAVMDYFQSDYHFIFVEEKSYSFEQKFQLFTSLMMRRAISSRKQVCRAGLSWLERCSLGGQAGGGGSRLPLPARRAPSAT